MLRYAQHDIMFPCHPERSEGSVRRPGKMLRFAQHDMTALLLRYCHKTFAPLRLCVKMKIALDAKTRRRKDPQNLCASAPLR